MSKAEELSIQIVDFLDNNDLSKRNLEKWVEDIIKAYADQEVKRKLEDAVINAFIAGQVKYIKTGVDGQTGEQYYNNVYKHFR